MQRVVFNANYLAYCDDAVDTWFRRALTPDGAAWDSLGFDFMLKTLTITWASPLLFGETADLACSVGRWGTTSFDVLVEGAVDGEPRFSTRITYVSVIPTLNRPTPIPSIVRELLG